MGIYYNQKTFVRRWRRQIGYVLAAVGVFLVLLLAARFIPGGISNLEMQSVVKSTSFTIRDFLSTNAINLPYHLLQHASVALFGVSVLSIKLPTILLATATIIGLIMLVNQWFKPGIAIIASLLAITTGQFLYFAQSGTPDIMYIFWPVWLLLIASLVTTQERYRKLLKLAFFLMAALSLYTPLSLYILIVIAIAIVLHPHLRYIIKQLSTANLVFGGIVVLAFISPLLITIVKSPNIGLTMLGSPTAWPDILHNLSLLGNYYFGFTAAPNATVLVPFFELGSSLMVAIGAYYVYKSRVTAKSYVVILWTFCLIPIIILNPNLIIVTFLPIVLLLAFGINGLLSHWYNLFPRNPYARIGGFILLFLLILFLTLSGISRHVYSYIYDPQVVPKFNKDLQLIPKDTSHIVVSDKELGFYQVVDEYNRHLTISTVPFGDNFLATRAAKRVFAGYQIDKIIVSPLKDNSDRFYIYKKTAQ